MKKIFFIAALFSGAIAANAEDLLQVVPFHTAANIEKTTDSYDTYENLFYINLKNDAAIANIIRFELDLPAGIDLNTAYDDADGTYAGEILENSRTKYKQGPKNVQTNHVIAYNKVTSSRPGYTKYIVLISQGTTTYPFAGTEGEIGSFQYCVGDVADGVYPIYIDNIDITNQKDKVSVKLPCAVSYVVVGNPLSANVELAGAIPSFVNEELAKETGIETLNLNGVTASYGTFTYVDGRNVVAPATEVRTDVAYKRAAGSNTYASLKLPFAADVNCYKFDGVDAEYAHFSTAADVAAGESVIVEGAIDVAASNVVLGGAEVGKANEGQFYLKNDEFHPVNVTAVVPAFRGVWNAPGVALSNLRLAIDGVVTGISAAQIDAHDSAYDLQGRQTVNAKNGVFVVNGKKQFVK